MQKHFLNLDSANKLKIGGVSGVDSMTDKQVVLSVDGRKLTIKGEGLVVCKLDTDALSVEMTCTAMHSMAYSQGGKLNLKGLFK